MARLLVGADFRPHACLSPESPKLETTRCLRNSNRNSTISKLAIVPRITDSELGKNWTHCSVYEQWRWIRSKGQKGNPSGGWEGGRLQK